MTPSQPKPLRILFIEDSEDDMQLLLRELRRGGYQPAYDRVETSDALSSALDKGDWDVILADFSMPKFSGIDALAQVRARDLDVPFLFVSGTIGEDTAVSAMRSGAQDYIMKSNLKRVVPAVDRELIEASKRHERRESRAQLRKLSRVVAQAQESVFITDQTGAIEYVNPGFERMTGYTADEVLGRTPALLKSGQHGLSFYQRLWGTITSGEVFQAVLVNRRKNGDCFFEEKVITPLKEDDGNITHFVSTGRDITARLRAEKDRGQLAAILEVTTDLVAILEPDGAVRYLNAAGRKLLGIRQQQDLTGLTWNSMFDEHQAQRLFSEVMPAVKRDGSWSGEAVLRGGEGQEIPVSQVVLAHRGSSDEIEYVSTIMRDTTERKRFEAELEHHATHDGLTGLANRLLLTDRTETAISTAKRSGRSLAVVFFDVDFFQRINTTLGHQAGDAMLQYVARRLRDCLQPSDTVARHGGDEFTLVVTDIGRIEDVVNLLRKVQITFRQPAVINSQELFVTFSIGVAMYPHDGRDAATLLRNAETAMYQAKSAGRDQYRFYAPVMNARGHELLAMEGELRRALEREQFVLHYQPQVNLRTGLIYGTEALIRWNHPDRGLISPAHFIPILEETGLIMQVGEWVLRKACQDTCSTGLAVSVNVSARQFEDRGFVDKVRSVLAETQIPPRKLELEITENILMRDADATTNILARLSGLGLRLAIDDFGTGYSSLAYLKRFRLQTIKIDQTFVQDVTTDPNDALIVETSITLGHKLGTEAVAEGVETLEQLNFLRKHGCDAVQGYFIGAPVPLDRLQKFIAGNRGRTVW